MVSGSKQVAFSQLIDSDTTTISPLFSLENGAKGLILVCKSDSYTDGSFTAELEESPDGITWFSLGSASALSSASAQMLKIADGPKFHVFRIKVVSTGTISGADIEASLHYTPNRL
jgi:hypothetical protein